MTSILLHDLLYVSSSSSQGPHSKILMTGGRGVRQRFIFYTQKNHNSKICLPKKITTFLAYPNKSLSPFFATPKNPSVFLHNLKKSWRLSQTQKNHFCQNFRPQKITRTSPSLTYVSGAPGPSSSSAVSSASSASSYLIHFCLYR